MRTSDVDGGIIRISQELLYIWTDNIYGNEVLYKGLHQTIKEKDWFPITKEQYEIAAESIREMGSEIKFNSIIPSISTKGFHINSCLVRLS